MNNAASEKLMGSLNESGIVPDSLANRQIFDFLEALE